MSDAEEVEATLEQLEWFLTSNRDYTSSQVEFIKQMVVLFQQPAFRNGVAATKIDRALYSQLWLCCKAICQYCSMECVELKLSESELQAEVTEELPNAAALIGMLEYLTSLLKVLRNICAGSTANQNFLYAIGCHEPVLHLLKKLHLMKAAMKEGKHEGEDSTDSLGELLLFARISIQFLCNLINDNEQLSLCLWDSFLCAEHSLSNFVELMWFGANQKDRKLAACLLILLYKYLVDNKYNSIHIVSQSKVLLQLLHKCILINDEDEMSLNDDLFYHVMWIDMLLLSENLIHESFFVMSDLKKHAGDVYVIPEQLIALRMIAYSLNVTTDVSESISHPQHLRLNDSQNLKMIQFLKELYSILYDLNLSNSKITDLPNDNTHQVQTVLIDSTLKVTLKLLGHCTSKSVDDYTMTEKKSVISILHNPSFLKASLQHLNELTTAPGHRNAIDESTFGKRSDLVRIVGNLCFRHRQNQDAVRDLNGIATLLNQCNYDDNSPMLREWGVFAVRNICEGNQENQAVIEALEVQGTAQSSVLNKAGLKLDLKDSKPVLKKL